jgi:hypothetical protein
MVDTKNKNENRDETEKQYSRFLEEIKLTHDYLKHTATLDTGIIVIMAAFLQKPTNPTAGMLVGLAILFALISLICTIRSQEYLISFLREATDIVQETPNKKRKPNYYIIRLFAYSFFMLSVAMLAIFVTLIIIST